MLDNVLKNQVRTDLPEFSVGDTISVTMKLDDGRSQVFAGLVLYLKGSGISKTFCIRKIASDNIGVEKIIPLNSPLITKIEVKKKGIVRRADISYMRNREGKNALKVKTVGKLKAVLEE